MPSPWKIQPVSHNYSCIILVLCQTVDRIYLILALLPLLFMWCCSARCFRTFCAEIPSFSAWNDIFLWFLCITKRVIGNGVNSNKDNGDIWIVDVSIAFPIVCWYNIIMGTRETRRFRFHMPGRRFSPEERKEESQGILQIRLCFSLECLLRLLLICAPTVFRFR